jgi:hypothetical protein
MAQRVLIGAMGNNIFADTEYEFENGQKVISNFFIHAIAELHNPDKVIVLLTDSAKEVNWEGKDKLQYWFKEQLPAVDLTSVRIEKGENEYEAWTIFNAVAEAIPENAELIVDVTNGLRSIPILMLSVIRYLQRIKNVTIREIYYCAADVVGPKVSTKPVYSVGMFNSLLDWSGGVEAFLRTGNSSQLIETIRLIGKDELGDQWNTITDHLKNLSEALDLLRVEQVMRSSDLLDRAIRNIDAQQAPDRLRPFIILLDNIRSEFSRFALQDTRNRPAIFLSKSLDLIDWYKSKKRYAEACLIAREWLVSWYAITKEKSNSFDRSVREQIIRQWNEMLESKDRNRIAQDERFPHISIWKELRTTRNDLGHPINDSPKPAPELIESINNVINRLKRLNK